MIKEEIKEIVGKSNRRELRKFGLTVGIFLIFVSGILFWRGFSSAYYFLISGIFLCILGVAIPVVLQPIYIGWMSFAVVMGFIMTRIILTLIFSLIFTPVGLVLRLLRKDPLKEKMDYQAQTYWIRRPQMPYDPYSSEKQY